MRIALIISTLMLLSISSGVRAAQGAAQFEVSVTNLTRGVNFTPLLAVSHSPALALYSLGEPASTEMAWIAEAGNTEPLYQQLQTTRDVYGMERTDGLLGPGDTVTFQLEVPVRTLWWGRFSLAAMLLPTNDSFIGLNGVRLPFKGAATYLANAYDAGSEPNDELCLNVPGPTCGGEGYSPAVDGEGYVYPATGAHGEGDLSVARHGWSGPVAKVTITRLH
ncbi:MAG: hypothetical protein CML06_20555 [Pseudomonadales bacterium]|nr:hypothetical protein [Pseudomonadales bacterium]